MPISPKDNLAIVEVAVKELLDESALDTVVFCAVPPSAPPSLPSAPPFPKTALLHVRFKENIPDVPSMARFLWKQALNYSLSRRRRLAFRAELNKKGPADVTDVADLFNIVRDTFIEFREKYPQRASEVGEVLAYCVALHHLEAPQILAKMSLKTSSNMPVHGLDGIHAKVENGAMTMYFLESKLAKTANDGAREYAESVAPFLTGQKQYLREYSLVGDLSNLDSLEGEARRLALEQFDVLGQPQIPRRERSVGVICYSEKRQFNAVPPLDDTQPVGFYENAFTLAYTKELQHHQKAAQTHLIANKVDPSKCWIFFVAVPDVNALRKLFYEAMGYNPASKK